MAAKTDTILEVEPRTDRGKNACGRLRRAGRVPGNVYGLDLPPFAVSVSARRIDEVLHLGSGQNTILTLTTADASQKRDVMIRELQRDPVTAQPVHLDFVRVDADKPVTVSVPVRLTGTAEGVKNEGGVLDFVHRDVSVSCLPSAIPEHLDVDITPLHINQHVSVGDLQVPEGVTVNDDRETIVATVSPSRAEVAATVTEGAEAQAEEPEVAKRGKEAEQEQSGGSKD